MVERARLESLAAAFVPRNGRRLGGLGFDLRSPDVAARAQTLVAAYYAIVCYFAVRNLYSWAQQIEAGAPEPRWPLFWIRFVDEPTGVLAVLWLHLAGGVLGLVAHRWRWARVVVLVSLLEFVALKYSFGSINHGDHLTVLIGFVLVFLPRAKSGAARRGRSVLARRDLVRTTLVFSGCQAMILLTYSMAGFWKIGGVVRQIVKGEVHALSPQGLAQQVAAKLLEDDTTSALGPWLIDNAWAGWPFMALTIYLQAAALWIVARPALHRWWGLGLIGFHVASHLTMGVGFAENTLWLGIFLVFSPFDAQPRALDERLAALPIVGRLRWWRSRRRRDRLAA